MLTFSQYVIITVLLGSLGSAAHAQSLPKPRGQSTPPTVVSGESWLMHLSRPFDDTSMGKTGALGPSPEPYEQVATAVASSIAEAALSGADLYRLNCQACHGSQGLGAPPEINSVINPVRAMSARLLLTRMKSRGMEISSSSANQLAREARAALLKRIHEGGDNMPSFSYLNEAETTSILAYLNELAQVPGGAKELQILRESPERVGELVVKSTCHICHGATGANPSPEQIFEGEIPPLETLTTRLNQANFIRKITQGLPVSMGNPPMPSRGRMPVFYYLSAKEAADAYLYLNYYPPVGAARAASTASSSDAPPGSPSDGGGSSTPTTGSRSSGVDSPPDAGMATSTVLLIGGLTVFVVMISLGGLAFTFREFARLSGMRTGSQLSNIAGEHQQDSPSLLHTRM